MSRGPGAHWQSGPRRGLPTCTGAQETQRQTPGRIAARARARPQFCPLGQHFAQLALKLRIRKPETGCSADLAGPASGDLRNAPRWGPAHATRAS